MKIKNTNITTFYISKQKDKKKVKVICDDINQLIFVFLITKNLYLLLSNKLPIIYFPFYNFTLSKKNRINFKEDGKNKRIKFLLFQTHPFF